jgi:FkbM family methyltransferase
VGSGYKKTFLIKSITIGHALALYGEFAEVENRLLVHVLRPGDWAVDIGANIGTVTLPMARAVGSEGRIVAFDPQRLVFQTLCTNLALNGVTNVDAQPLAVSDRREMVSIPALDPLSPHNFGAVAVIDEIGTPTESVPAIPLDEWVLPKCRLIKIDVEGMEHAVLRGAENTIGRHRPLIYFEAKRGENTRNCLAWLMERNYRLWWHFATFFNYPNFRNDSNNVFGNTGDINALAMPAEFREYAPNLPRIAAPDADWEHDYRVWLGGGGRLDAAVFGDP